MHTYTCTRALLSSLKKTISKRLSPKEGATLRALFSLPRGQLSPQTRAGLFVGLRAPYLRTARVELGRGGGGGSGLGVRKTHVSPVGAAPLARHLVSPKVWLSLGSREGEGERGRRRRPSWNRSQTPIQSGVNAPRFRLTSGPDMQMLAVAEFLHAWRPKSWACPIIFLRLPKRV